ncbi:MAG: hypothetical protein PHS45_00320 [Bacilli bacterium]|nr:hypothetical protein [Bacilli bacterium]
MLFDARYDLNRENMNGDIDYTYGYDCGDYERPVYPNPAPETPAGPPIVHSPQIRCVTRQIVHEVPHICPVHTQITNQHICRHTYRPSYTCGEQNQVCHVHEGSCNQF